MLTDSHGNRLVSHVTDRGNKVLIPAACARVARDPFVTGAAQDAYIAYGNLRREAWQAALRAARQARESGLSDQEIKDAAIAAVKAL